MHFNFRLYLSVAALFQYLDTSMHNSE